MCIEVFAFEQNCPIEEEFDTKTILIQIVSNLLLKKMMSALALQNILLPKNKIKIERVCVKKIKKIVKRIWLMNVIHDKLINDEIKIVEISAQISAINFIKISYIEEGNHYIEAGIEHIKMKSWIT